MRFKRQFYKTYSCIVTFFLLVINVSCSGQQQSNFSGTWKRNDDETVFSSRFPKNSTPFQLSIIQSRDSISIERFSNNRENVTHSYIEVLPLNGKAIETNNRSTKKTSFVSWSPAAKALKESASYYDDSAPPEYVSYNATELYKLSSDGKRLTIDRVDEMSNGNDSTKTVYDKQ